MSKFLLPPVGCLRDGWWDHHLLNDVLKRVGRERDLQKHTYPSTKDFNESSHYVGLLGELVFAVETDSEVNLSLLSAGHYGHDFRINGVEYEVKTATHPDPDLKEFQDPKRWADVYILAGTHEYQHWAKIFGWVTGKQLKKAATRTYVWGEPAKHFINHKDKRMTPGLPRELQTLPKAEFGEFRRARAQRIRSST